LNIHPYLRAGDACPVYPATKHPRHYETTATERKLLHCNSISAIAGRQIPAKAVYRVWHSAMVSANAQLSRFAPYGALLEGPASRDRTRAK
jgi:hypothetical protein